jgi:hypothetical protein
MFTIAFISLFYDETKTEEKQGHIYDRFYFLILRRDENRRKARTYLRLLLFPYSMTRQKLKTVKTCVTISILSLFYSETKAEENK